MKYHHKVSLSKIQNSGWAGKNLWLQIFWDTDGVIHIDIFEPGIAISAKLQCSTL